MNRFFTIFLVSFFVYSYSQKYDFDAVSVYATENKKLNTTFNNVMFSNTKNPGYFLKIKNIGNHLLAYLYDLSDNQQHIFKAFDNKNNQEQPFTFEYLASEKITFEKSFSKIESLVISKNRNNKTATIKVVKNKNKKPIGEYHLNFDDDERNLFFIFKNNYFSLMEDYRDFEIKESGLVINAMFYGNSNCSYVLKKFAPTKLQLTVPSKLVSK